MHVWRTRLESLVSLPLPPLCSSIKTQVKRSVSSSGLSILLLTDRRKRRCKRMAIGWDRLSINSLRRQVQFLRTNIHPCQLIDPAEQKLSREHWEPKAVFWSSGVIRVHVWMRKERENVNAWEQAREIELFNRIYV